MTDSSPHRNRSNSIATLLTWILTLYMKIARFRTSESEVIPIDQKATWPALIRVGRLQPRALLRLRAIHLAHLAFILTATVLLTVNLTTWPASWFDEGLNLSAAGTLSSEGEYGLSDSDGTRIMDPAIQTGPVVVVPIALVFDLLGVGLLQARLTMVLFAILALGAFYLLARQLGGMAPALAAGFALLIGNGEPFTSYLPMSRQVLGEVTALGLFCIGAWLLARFSGGSSHAVFKSSLATGAVFGLAMITKSQMALILPIAMGLFWIANLYYHRSIQWWSPIVVMGVAMACVLGWYAIQIGIAGSEEMQRNSSVLREGFAIHIASISTMGPRSAIEALWQTGYIFWGVPSLIYGFRLASKRDRSGLAHALPLLLIVSWLFWFTFLSIGWSRYAAIPLMLTALFTGRLVVDLARNSASLSAGRYTRRLAPLGGALLVSLLLVMGGSTVTRGVFGQQNTDAEDMADYLNEEIAPGAVIESWAWELDILAPQRFHYPETHATNVYTLEIWKNQQVSDDVYDPGVANPDYIMESPFSSWTGIYSSFIAERGVLVSQYGDYSLYKVVD